MIGLGLGDSTGQQGPEGHQQGTALHHLSSKTIRLRFNIDNSRGLQFTGQSSEVGRNASALPIAIADGIGALRAAVFNGIILGDDGLAPLVCFGQGTFGF